METPRGVEIKIFRKKKLQDQDGRNFYVKRSSHKNIQYSHHIYCLAYCLANLFPGLLESPKCQIVYFISSTIQSGESPGGISTTCNISFQSRRTWSCLKHVSNNFILGAPTSILFVLFCFCGYFLADVWYWGVFSAKKQRRYPFSWSNAYLSNNLSFNLPLQQKWRCYEKYLMVKVWKFLRKTPMLQFL